MGGVTIGEEPLSVAEVLQVVRGAPVELGDEAQALIKHSNAIVNDALAAGDPIYGLNTGVGHMKDVLLTQEQMQVHQETLIMTHFGGWGANLSNEVVRAAMVVRLNGIARGGSGASLASAEILAAMLNAGVHPLLPATGSVGAGDLTQMAGVARVAVGKGMAEFEGNELPAQEALRRAGITPLTLGPKDGLAIMSANGISVGHGALVIERARRVADALDSTMGLSLEATRGNPLMASPVVADAKPYRGQVEAIDSIGGALRGSYLYESGVPRSIQDPLSFRVAPQVHGALREVIAFASRSVEIELNSRSDNPLVSIPEHAMLHNGNFHPVVLAVAFDSVRVALAHAGQLSERRMSHLWKAFFEGLNAQGGSASKTASLIGLSLRYPAAAALAELKQLAAPATLDCPPLDIGIIGTEDHATSAPLSVRKTESALDLLEDILTVEVLMARDVFGTMNVLPRLGKGTGKVLRAAEEALDALTEVRSPGEAHRVVRATFLRSS